MQSTCSKSCYVEHEMVEKPKDITRKAAYDRPHSGAARLSVAGLNRSTMVVSGRSQKTFADKRMQKLLKTVFGSGLWTNVYNFYSQNISSASTSISAISTKQH